MRRKVFDPSRRGYDRSASPLLLGFAALILLGACDEVKQGLTAASAELDAVFGVDRNNTSAQEARSGPNTTSATAQTATTSRRDGEAAYQAGLAQQNAGDDRAAVASFRSAAEQGHAGAAYALGLAYSSGRGVEKDLQIAANWLNTAADRGDARAQYLAGVNLSTGAGVERDLNRAAGYWEQAAIQGHPRAQHLLAQAYADGHGVSKDVAWAAMWYGKAARQGHRESQFSYGVLRATGRGLPRDPLDGYVWISLASREGHAQAEEVRRSLAAKLTADERTRAESMAASFRARAERRFVDRQVILFVQYRLNGLGYAAGPVDGVQGPTTRSAVIAYQERAGLTADGLIGRQVLRALLAEPK
jgi:TPR repeat protein